VVQASAPQMAARASAVPDIAPQPTTFRGLVELFALNREGNLYAELCSYVHPVRLAEGKLEVRVVPDASPHLVPRMGQCLSQWTGQRWIVAVVDEAGGPTLAEEDKEIERRRHEKAEAHPLMQAVRAVFADSKIVNLKQKEVAPLAVESEDADESTLLEIEED